jgi:hypothetical protein
VHPFSAPLCGDTSGFDTADLSSLPAQATDIVDHHS